MDRYSVESTSTRKTISTRVNVTDAETLYGRGPRVTGEAKRRYNIRDYFSKARTIPKVLNKDIQLKGRYVSSDSEGIVISVCKKLIVTTEGRGEMII